LPEVQGLWWDRLTIDVDVSVGDYIHPRSKGYWLHQVKVYAEGYGRAHLSLDELLQYLHSVGEQSRVFSFNTTIYDVLQEAYITLKLVDASNHELKLKAQLLALWLNKVANYTSGYSLELPNGTVLTADEIINIVETALLNEEVDKYESLALLCEEYNTRWDS
jgi:hypothetical protein